MPFWRGGEGSFGKGFSNIFDPLNLGHGDTSAEDYQRSLGQNLMSNAPRPADLEASQITMAPDMDQRLGMINTDKSGINAFRNEALRNGPSSYANLANQQQNLLSMQGRDRAAREAASSTAGARSSLAMHGGMGSGAAERLLKSGNKNYLSMSQDVANSEAQNKGQIGMNDEQNRIQQLGMLPGMENQAIAPDLQKAQMYGQARAQDIDQVMKQYQAKMKAFEGGQQANATLNAKGGKK